MKYLNKFVCGSHSFSCCFTFIIRNYTTKMSPKVRRKGIICQPTLPQNVINAAENVVGLHIGLNDISWTRININQSEIMEMGTTNFPSNFDKMSLCELSSYANQTIKMLPTASYYVIEEMNKSVNSKAGRQELILQGCRLQYIAMLVALFNYSITDEDNLYNKVLFLKYRLTGKLFGTLVGSEIVSTTKMVNKIFRKERSALFTPVKYSSEIISHFNRHNRIEQELIGQSLLLTLTFLELVIYRNKKCLEFVGFSSD